MNLREVKLSSRAHIPLALALPIIHREPEVRRPTPSHEGGVTIDLVEHREQREHERELRGTSCANDPLYFYL